MNKKIWWVILILIIAAVLFSAGFWLKKTQPSPNLPPATVTHYYLDKTTVLEPVKTKGQDLPQTLVIKPGQYVFQSRTFDLKNEGLYSFSNGEKYYHRIAYNRDRIAFMSALSWLDKPSAESKSNKYDDLINQALAGYFNVSCGNLANFANTFSYKNGISARVILGLNPDQSSIINTDSGHNMLEVMVNGKWVVFDLTNNTVFDFKDNAGLSFWEFYQKVLEKKPFKISPLAGDTNGRTEEQLRQYYQDVFKIPLISDDTHYRFPSDDPKVTEQIIQYSKKYYPMTRFDWLKRFYYGYGYK